MSTNFVPQQLAQSRILQLPAFTVNLLMDNWPSSEWKCNWRKYEKFDRKWFWLVCIFKDKIIFDKLYCQHAHTLSMFMPQWGKSASMFVPQWGKNASMFMHQWVFRPFWAHERSKPGARYDRRCFSESCLSESCFSESSSGTTLRVLKFETSTAVG